MTHLAAVLVLVGMLVAHDDAEPFADWYNGLRNSDTGAWCCSQHDCRTTEHRLGPTGYEVPINGVWVAVPAAAILRGTPNPTGSAVVCVTPAGEIRCFVIATET